MLEFIFIFLGNSYELLFSPFHETFGLSLFLHKFSFFLNLFLMSSMKNISIRKFQRSFLANTINFVGLILNYFESEVSLLRGIENS